MAAVSQDIQKIPLAKSSKEQTKPIESESKVDLFKFFHCVINKEELTVNAQQVQDFYCNDLNIDILKFDPQLMNVLLEVLEYYMTTWPGWQFIQDTVGNLQYTEWYGRFRSYLVLKTTSVIKNAGKYIKQVNDDCQVKTTNRATQTKSCGLVKGEQKKVAPFTLCVTGPPSVLNNIVFMEVNGTILIKQHAEKPWQPLLIQEFLQWPYVSAEVKLPDIALTRTCAHKFERYVSISGHNTLMPEVNYISYVKKIKNDCDVQPYSYNYISTYLKQFIQVVKRIPGVLPSRVQELEIIFQVFLQDIQEVNLHNCTMATNISVGYQIGKCKYIRSKKMGRRNAKMKTFEATVVTFSELVIPQIDFALQRFEALQDERDKINVSFQSLNKLAMLIAKDKSHSDVAYMKKRINEWCITYRCTLCSKKFIGEGTLVQLTNHFLLHHKAENDLLCFQCGKEFSVKNLAGLRWKHTCSDYKKIL